MHVKFIETDPTSQHVSKQDCKMAGEFGLRSKGQMVQVLVMLSSYCENKLLT